MRVARIIGIILLFVFLTVLTQIGGIIYLLTFTLRPYFNKKIKNGLTRGMVQLLTFLVLYAAATFVIVPLIAKPFGRLPLPVAQTQFVRPVNFLTCVLNRHYVTPVLKRITLDVAADLNKTFPGTTINYLDTGFPFFNNFPLFPHLSHDDGKKMDLSFYYTETSTGSPTNASPSFFGYGICEEPAPGETNIPDSCSRNGYWQYSFLKKFVPQASKKNFRFDNNRTKKLLLLFAARPETEKIFIEPHLRKRLGLTGNKFRFHGCKAVRHDDHVHIQVR